MKEKKGMKISTTFLLEGLIAYLIVNDLPALISGWTNKTFSGLSEDIVGIGAGVVAGLVFHKPLITNASLVVGGGNILNGVIYPSVMKVAGQTAPANLLPAANKKVSQVAPALNGYTNLRVQDYVTPDRVGDVTRYENYKNYYLQN